MTEFPGFGVNYNPRRPQLNPAAADGEQPNAIQGPQRDAAPPIQAREGDLNLEPFPESDDSDGDGEAGGSENIQDLNESNMARNLSAEDRMLSPSQTDTDEAVGRRFGRSGSSDNDIEMANL